MLDYLTFTAYIIYIQKNLNILFKQMLLVSNVHSVVVLTTFPFICATQVLFSLMLSAHLSVYTTNIKPLKSAIGLIFILHLIYWNFHIVLHTPYWHGVCLCALFDESLIADLHTHSYTQHALHKKKIANHWVTFTFVHFCAN